MLTSVQVNQYKSEGYVMVPGFFDGAEVKLLQQEVRRLRDTGCFRNVATMEDGETPTQPQEGANWQMVPMDHRSDVIRAISLSEKVASAVSALLGDPVYKILDQSFCKPARIGLPTNWHQDNAYFRISDPLKGTAMWIAVDDASSLNGTLKVKPRQFSLRFRHYRDPESDHHIRMDEDEREVVHCELKAGGVVFFAYGTPHATGANRSGADRTGIGIHYLNGHYFSRHESGARDHREQNVAITGPDVCGGENRYGRDFRGVWQQLVEAV